MIASLLAGFVAYLTFSLGIILGLSNVILYYNSQAYEHRFIGIENEDEVN